MLKIPPISSFKHSAKSKLLGLAVKLIPCLASITLSVSSPTMFSTHLGSSHTVSFPIPEYAMASSLSSSLQGTEVKAPEGHPLTLRSLGPQSFPLPWHLCHILHKVKMVYFKNLYDGMLHNSFLPPRDCESLAVSS